MADRQHGVVARRQLVELGLTPSMLAVRIGERRLLRLHRGVYAVGHARLTREGEWLAAVLAAGPGAWLSHRSAAALHGLLPERGRRVDVATGARRASSNWVEVHPRQVACEADLTTVRGIPVTTVARTLVDLAGSVSAEELERAVNEADVLGRLDRDAVAAALERTRGRRGPGHAALRRALATHDGPRLLRLELERRFARLVAASGLPRPRANVRLHGWEVDALWEEQRVVVELDSWRYHRTPRAWERDRRKERELRAAGWDVRRLTWADVSVRGGETARELGEALAGSGAAGGERAAR